ncbi:HNH endonuclease [Flavobacterium silvaticum]|uniref:HNH nuclease domain-containing protein n=1 Tax=Flavobacterium silvaticum TaxID=1852020 RepID=A0A972JGD6_9FLAO|nr:HNH endonuclease [Flavobacterium silvaticum]NMH26745.1 hypothetical protein [Flavobacterium silvaticum]
MEIIYQICKQVFENQITRKEGIQALVDQQNMNRNSAVIVVNIFVKMMNGERFTRTLSNPLFEYFLENIFLEYGKEKLEAALTALDLHITYIWAKGNPKRRLRLICNMYFEKLRVSTFQSTIESLHDEVEQNEIISYLKRTKSKQEVLAELNSITAREPEIVTINHKAYKRDNKTIALIKIVRDFKCQICQTFIPKSNGEKYIEAAHIIPKHEQGQELPENIILFCPNHHKEFDLGSPNITKKDKSSIEFTLNGKEYKINLSFN